MTNKDCTIEAVPQYLLLTKYKRRDIINKNIFLVKIMLIMPKEFEMKKQNKNRLYKKRVMRSVCAVMCVILLLASCVGCTSIPSSEEVSALKDKLARADGEIDSLKKENEAAKGEIASLNSDHESAKNELDILKNINQEALDEIASLKESNQAAKQNIDSLKSSNKSAQQSISDLKESNEAAKQEIAALKESNQAARDKIAELEGGNEALEQELERLREQLKELEDSMPPSEPVNKIRIYIDQGHNPTSYHNAGAYGNGLYEQDLTFAIGCLLADLLEDDGRFEICLSRPTQDTVLGTDNTSSLAARVKGAQDFGAEYFISLHINSFDSESANGIEVLAAEQGSVSYVFGESLLQGLVDSTNLKNRGMKLNPDLHVLKNATMPAVLVEMGFISNAGDAALLAEDPQLFAKGIYDGILAYFDLTPN